MSRLWIFPGCPSRDRQACQLSLHPKRSQPPAKSVAEEEDLWEPSSEDPLQVCSWRRRRIAGPIALQLIKMREPMKPSSRGKRAPYPTSSTTPDVMMNFEKQFSTASLCSIRN